MTDLLEAARAPAGITVDPHREAGGVFGGRTPSGVGVEGQFDYTNIRTTVVTKG